MGCPIGTDSISERDNESDVYSVQGESRSGPHLWD